MPLEAPVIHTTSPFSRLSAQHKLLTNSSEIPGKPELSCQFTALVLSVIHLELDTL